jgi:hypothetical protein
MVRTTEHKSLTKSHQKSSVRLCSLSQNILQYRAISSNPTRLKAVFQSSHEAPRCE